jgi:hypothetical protein
MFVYRMVLHHILLKVSCRYTKNVGHDGRLPGQYFKTRPSEYERLDGHFPSYRRVSQRKTLFVRFEVFTAVTVKNAVFWDVVPCILRTEPTFRRNVGSVRKTYTTPHRRTRHSSRRYLFEWHHIKQDGVSGDTFRFVFREVPQSNLS